MTTKVDKVSFLARDILPRRCNENQLSPAIPHSGGPDSSAHTDSLSTFKTVENIKKAVQQKLEQKWTDK